MQKITLDDEKLESLFAGQMVGEALTKENHLVLSGHRDYFGNRYRAGDYYLRFRLLEKDEDIEDLHKSEIVDISSASLENLMDEGKFYYFNSIDNKIRLPVFFSSKFVEDSVYGIFLKEFSKGLERQVGKLD